MTRARDLARLGNTQAFSVDANLNVGIGTTNPTTKLDVDGTLFSRRNNASSEGGQVNFARSLDNTTAYSIDVFGSTAENVRLRFIDAADSSERATIDRAGNFIIGAASSTGTASQRLQVTGGGYISGSVGIGTTRPTSKLQVQGSANINNTLPVTVSYASSFRVSTQETDPKQVAFSNDGKTMYILGNTGDDITYYTLSTPWDITTSTFISQFSIAGQLTIPLGFYFKPDGTKFYVVGSNGVGAAATSVNQYTCTIPWDLTTASYDSVAFSVLSQDTVPQEVDFKPDGTKMYVLGGTLDRIYQYSLSTPWNVSTASYDNVLFSVTNEEINPEGLKFSLDGTKLLVTGAAGDDINYYTLSTPWDISTTSFVGIITSLSSVMGETNQSGLYWKPDGSKLYALGSGNDSVYQFNVTSDADLEVTGQLDIYGNANVYEKLNVFGEQNVYANAYFGNRVGIGTTVSTGTASQPLQVSGGAYVSGSVGIGTTNPTSSLHVIGNATVSGVITATSFVGDGTGLTGVESWSQTDTWLYG